MLEEGDVKKKGFKSTRDVTKINPQIKGQTALQLLLQSLRLILCWEMMVIFVLVKH